MKFNGERAETELAKAAGGNPGRWVKRSMYVAQACRNIAGRCAGMDPDTAYALGLMHDIGRKTPKTNQRHMLDGYSYCKELGWDKAAQVCITHELVVADIRMAGGKQDMTKDEIEFVQRQLARFEYDDYDRLVQLCDALTLPTGFCMLEKRFVEIALKEGVKPNTLEKWKKTLALKEYFEKKMGCSIYEAVPEAVENSIRAQGDGGTQKLNATMLLQKPAAGYNNEHNISGRKAGNGSSARNNAVMGTLFPQAGR